MTPAAETIDRDEWICEKCSLPLTAGKTQAFYLGSAFSLAVLTCPGCGMVLVTEEMAVAKMAEAEQILEDK